MKKGFNFGRVQKRRLYGNDLINKNEMESLSVVCTQGKIKIILLLSLFWLLFMSFIIFFVTIYGSHCIILTNFYLYLSFIYSTFNNKFLVSVK